MLVFPACAILCGRTLPHEVCVCMCVVRVVGSNHQGRCANESHTLASYSVGLSIQFIRRARERGGCVWVAPLEGREEREGVVGETYTRYLGVAVGVILGGRVSGFGVWWGCLRAGEALQVPGSRTGCVAHCV
jgi:hypothetical protein